MVSVLASKGAESQTRDPGDLLLDVEGQRSGPGTCWLPKEAQCREDEAPGACWAQPPVPGQVGQRQGGRENCAG